MNTSPSTLPARTGVSLKPIHYRHVLEQRPDTGWFEVHPENYMGTGGPPHKYLTAIRENYPLSMHGVGMSLGSATGIDQDHLEALALLVSRYEPQQVSEHLSWSQVNGIYHNDLLPLPYTGASLRIMVNNIATVQDRLGRNILIENPSSYIAYAGDSWSEPEFMTELVRRSGCGVLLDINNIHVSACNLGLDTTQYLEQVPLTAVAEIHLAGHTVLELEGETIRIDDHGSPVAEPVWSLYETVLEHLGRPCPVLIEWDTNIPGFEVLVQEADRADRIATGVFSNNSAGAVA